MNLHVRLYINFWSHRKTAKLRSLIGNDAYWIPPRIWSYAAENQPNGDFSTYTPEELCLLIGYLGNAQALLEALQQACFMDGMKVHDWEIHNGYHHEYSERAKKAAKARWEKERGKDKKGEDRIGDKHCSKHATSINEPKIDDGFNDFWKEYPKKVGKGDALKSWKKINPSMELKAKIMETIAWQKASKDWIKEDGKYIPNPATWLNQGRWDDEQVKQAEKIWT